jgi:hypothetical protein
MEGLDAFAPRTKGRPTAKFGCTAHSRLGIDFKDIFVEGGTGFMAQLRENGGGLRGVQLSDELLSPI